MNQEVLKLFENVNVKSINGKSSLYKPVFNALCVRAMLFKKYKIDEF